MQIWFPIPCTEELDEDGVHFIYMRRCKEDCFVVPYNLEILLFWGASMNLQHVSKHGFKPSIFQSQNPVLMLSFLKIQVIRNAICVQH